MEKSKISKIIALLIICVLITCVSTPVFADEDPIDLSKEETEQNPNEGDDGYDNLSGEIEEEEEQKPVEKEEEQKPVEKEEEKTESKYDENDLPYAGPEDTLLMVVLFIALAGVSGFTFLKLSEYSNI